MYLYKQKKELFCFYLHLKLFKNDIEYTQQMRLGQIFCNLERVFS